MGPYGFNDRNTAIKLRDMVRNTVQAELTRSQYPPTREGLSFINKTGETIPPYGVVYIRSNSGFFGTRAQPFTVQVIKRSQVAVDGNGNSLTGEENLPLFNGPSEVEPDGRGHSQIVGERLSEGYVRARIGTTNVTFSVPYGSSSSSPFDLVPTNSSFYIPGGALWEAVTVLPDGLGLFRRKFTSEVFPVIYGTLDVDADSATIQDPLPVSVIKSNDPSLIGTIQDVIFFSGNVVGEGAAIVAQWVEDAFYVTGSSCVEIAAPE